MDVEPEPGVPDVLDDEQDGEYYWNKAKGRIQKRKGRRRRRKGPQSMEEQNYNDSHYRVVQAERRMHGELAQVALRDLTVHNIFVAKVLERYSFENIRDLHEVDVEQFREELGAVVVQDEQDADLYEGIRDDLR